jgi:hypothetical protein
LRGLPVDYKQLVEELPDGLFLDWLRVHRPGVDGYPATAFLGREAGLLEDMRGWRDKGHRSYPYSIYPEPNGLLPWGWGRHGEQYCWITDSGGPNRWKVVSTDRAFKDWDVHSGSLCSFLVVMLAGDIELLDGPNPDTLAASPAYVRLVPPEGESEVGTPDLGRSFSAEHGRPTSESDDLLIVLGGSVQSKTAIDWDSVEAGVGFRFPTDYRSFLDRFGAGTFCDIRILSPNRQDRFGTLPVLAELFAAVPDRRKPVAAHAYRNLVTWGITVDGWTLNWRADKGSPDNWGVAMVPPTISGVTTWPTISFSSFLLGYSGHRRLLDSPRPVWWVGAVFKPVSEPSE